MTTLSGARAAVAFLPTAVAVIVASILLMNTMLPVGPWVVSLGACVLAVALALGLAFRSLVPELVFGAIDTSVLTVFALAGGFSFGVMGAIVGGVVGDAVSDGIAGLFEGWISEWLHDRGFDSSRSALGSSMGKMAGCLAGCGLVLTAAWIAGVDVREIVRA